MGHTPKQNFIRHTVNLWQRYYPEPLYQEEAQEIICNLTQFMDTLSQWDQPHREKGS